jgi:hypothetical protein
MMDHLGELGAIEAAAVGSEDNEPLPGWVQAIGAAIGIIGLFAVVALAGSLVN